MNALLFPGQGSQIVGMGIEFYENFKIVKEIFNQADEKLNLPLSKIILKGPEKILQLTENTQPAILTVSYSILQVIKKEFNFDLDKFKYYGGHSLGEYSALVCAESLEFLDAVYLLRERGAAMQKAVPVGEGGMLAVLGSSVEQIKELLKSNKGDGVCEIANDNANGQVIVSGNIEMIKNFQLILKSNKTKSIPLKVSAPFHCSLMNSAAENLKEKIENTLFKVPKKSIINNVNADVESDPNNIKKLLTDQISSTVRWRESIIKMSKDGIKDFVEIGPGKALSGMVKRTIEGANCFSINSIADIKNLDDRFKR